MKLLRRFFDSKAVPLLVVAGVVFFIAESKFGLRRRTGSRLKRLVTNSAVSLPAFSLLRFLLLPVMVKMALLNKTKQAGLNYHYQAPTLLKSAVAFLLLDYSNYLWHVIMHKLPLMWRFHLVHHSDLDLDLSTAFRFHFGEMIGSVFFRGASVFAIGASPWNVLFYEAVFEAATQFHHSNWKLPYKVEKVLNKVIVTPRMHGIHHSMIKQETDSNYSVIFSWWDRLHNTLRLNVPQDLVVIGVPAYSNPQEQTISFLWKLPFTNIRPWDSPGDHNTKRGTAGGQTCLAK